MQAFLDKEEQGQGPSDRCTLVKCSAWRDDPWTSPRSAVVRRYDSQVFLVKYGRRKKPKVWNGHKRSLQKLTGNTQTHTPHTSGGKCYDFLVSALNGPNPTGSPQSQCALMLEQIGSVFQLQLHLVLIKAKPRAKSCPHPFMSMLF